MTRVRSREPKSRRKLPEEEIIRILKIARTNWDTKVVRGLEKSDFFDMMGCASRLKKTKDDFEVDAPYAREGKTGTYEEFRKNTSFLNLAKLLLLQRLCPGAEDLWASVLGGRSTREGGSVDGMLGKELELLTEAVEKGYVITVEEAARVQARHAKKGPDYVDPKPCDSYTTKRHCRFGTDCKYIHMVDEKHLGPEDQVYAGFMIGVR